MTILTRFKELPVTKYDANFKAPSYLKIKNFDMNSQSFKDIRGKITINTEVCQSLQPIQAPTSATLSHTFLYDGVAQTVDVT